MPPADRCDMSALAVETVAVARLRLVQGPSVVESWELHSELAVVSAEVRQQALELLPEREPEAFLAAIRRTAVSTTAVGAERELPLAAAVAAYILLRLLQTVRSGALFLGACAAVPLLVELLR